MIKYTWTPVRNKEGEMGWGKEGRQMYQVTDHTPCLPQTYLRFVKVSTQRGNVSMETSECKPALALPLPRNSIPLLSTTEEDSSGHTQHKVKTSSERDLGTSASIHPGRRMPPFSEVTQYTMMQPDILHVCCLRWLPPSN